ncbi:glycine cleavage system aminomethyltransferase GcvT [Thermobifida fusca]|jgi:aminomethyltransferase|uniref:Aminomethyltransferase n=2 Tax=Thermobifida fusca TaxID=2021 RepID=A0A9P2T9U4_THEFU|nr:glycine cleavage system aminomethyltransferase GcvT [Thermobifida fusca]AAZ56384.1 aminomethyltransferase [Thermobifida fusca YX]EOR70559.1 glycine cleavage system aminomethyltransferase T [Thermobifida fusca TM51]PZN63333.1 MAG: glycine cleavage system aminomethyltransferase GcvT [Thermobifida fusca]
MTQPPTSDARTTPLYDTHVASGATMVEFAGWLMPLRYRSESAEHRAVRDAAGLFDLSHMGEIRVHGPQAADCLDYALVGQLSTLAVGRARYTMIVTEQGGVLDDLIVYRLADDDYLVVANAANTGTVAAALTERAAGFTATITDETADYALLALQGPQSAAILGPLTDVDLSALRPYAAQHGTVAGTAVLLSRTGYTGEDGFEIYLRPGTAAPALWDTLVEAGQPHGLLPAGLAARDTLRLEAGMPLYGNELTAELTPYDAGLGRVVKLDKPGDFVGRAALAARASSGPTQVLVGLVGRGRRVPRKGYPVLRDGVPVGTVTSGAPSPTLGKPIAIAAVKAGTDLSSGAFAVDVRGRAEAVDVVDLPFYRRTS